MLTAYLHQQFLIQQALGGNRAMILRAETQEIIFKGLGEVQN